MQTLTLLRRGVGEGCFIGFLHFRPNLTVNIMTPKALVVALEPGPVDMEAR